MADIIQVRRDTAANWTSADPTLAQGEIGYETDTNLMKIGDGSTAWTSLAYVELQGVTGIQGETGVQGIQGDTGPQGIQGDTGPQGATGPQGETGLFAYTSHDAGTFGTTGANFDSSNGLSQNVTLVNGGETGVFYVSSMNAGEKMTIKFDYDVTEVPRGSTGIKWANGLFPAMSGDTGVEDIITVYYDGTNYYGQASLGYDYE